MAKTIVTTKLYRRLIEAFDSLEQGGIIYNAGSGYTEDDAMDDLAAKFHELTPEAREAVWGYCLYHEQDAARALKGEGLNISFGALNDEPPTVLKAGETVSAALMDHGFSVEWDGSVHRRIRINPYS